MNLLRKLAVLFVVVLSPMAANADAITTSVGNYDVTTVEGSFSEFAALLMDQIWWGDDVLAAEFVELSQSFLGISALNTSTYGGVNTGALFAICDDACLTGGLPSDFPIQSSGYSYGFGEVFFYGIDDRRATWATATRVPEPGTLALLGIGLVGMAATRRRRKV